MAVRKLVAIRLIPLVLPELRAAQLARKLHFPYQRFQNTEEVIFLWRISSLFVDCGLASTAHEQRNHNPRVGLVL
jgi:hypothetical protein